LIKNQTQEESYKKEEKQAYLKKYQVAHRKLDSHAATVFMRKANEVDLELTKIANKYLEQKMAVQNQYDT